MENLNIIGDSGKKRKSMYDPDLADKVNKETEAEIRKEQLEAKLGKQKEKSPKNEDIQRKENVNEKSPLEVKNLDHYILLPQQDIYVAIKPQPATKWNLTIEDLQKEGARMLTLREFVDFLLHLRGGEVHNGLGKRISNTEIQKIYNSIVSPVGNLYSEWLDTRFKFQNDDLKILTRNITQGTERYREVHATKIELLEDCLMSESYIDLDYWLEHATSQGLPPVDTPEGHLYYSPPGTGINSVVRFGRIMRKPLQLSCSTCLYKSAAEQYVRPVYEASKVKK